MHNAAWDAAVAISLPEPVVRNTASSEAPHANTSGTSEIEIAGDVEERFGCAVPARMHSKPAGSERAVYMDAWALIKHLPHPFDMLSAASRHILKTSLVAARTRCSPRRIPPARTMAAAAATAPATPTTVSHHAAVDAHQHTAADVLMHL
jgi:hypothetical protein